MDPKYEDRALAWAQAERERAAVVVLGEDLAAVDVEILVFKGIHLAFAVANEPERRLCLDADVLVTGGGFERAAARIRALSRWELHDANFSTYGATLRETGAYVDIHRWPLPPRWGRFDVAAARARAVRRPDVFGPHVLVPDPLDAAKLAVANFTKDLLGYLSHGQLADDLRLLETHASVTPPRLAERLVEHGLRRAGLLAFVHLAREDAAWRPYADACSVSRPEARLIDAFARALPTLATRSEAVAFIAVRGVGDSAGASASSAALAALRILRDYVVEHW
jgi:hypothetical protein